MIQLEVYGAPHPWSRPAIFRGKESNVVFDKQKKEKEEVRWQISAQYNEEILTMPMLVDITFRMPIPESTTDAIRRDMINGEFHHCKKPDIDNLCKFILDCMNQLIFKDDSQICTLYSRKVYSTTPSTIIRIKPYTRNERNGDAFSDNNEEINGGNSGVDGRGDLPRGSSDQERVKKARGKKNCIINIRDG